MTDRAEHPGRRYHDSGHDPFARRRRRALARRQAQIFSVALRTRIERHGQTIEGIRLNNLCANGAYSGVYWNDGSFQEISYVTGADSSEMGQGGVRVSMVPKDGGNMFRGTIMGSFTGDGWSANNLGDNLVGDLTFNPSNRLTNVSDVQKIWDFNPSIGGPIVKDKVWFNFTYRHWGVEKTVAGSYFDADPSPFRYVADTSRPAVDDGHIVSRAGRLAWQITSKDKLTVTTTIRASIATTGALRRRCLPTRLPCR